MSSSPTTTASALSAARTRPRCSRRPRTVKPTRATSGSASKRESWASTSTACATSWPPKASPTWTTTVTEQTAIPCTVMRGGTSKGLYFLASDLPADPAARDALLLAAMGSPDARQIDGIGGAHPLTSKVAVVSPASRPDADVDYLFLQVVVDKAEVSDSQNCGNLLAGIGPFAIEHGLVPAAGEMTSVRIHMINTASI